MNKIIDYLGSKEKLFGFITDNIKKYYSLDEDKNFLDLFAGSNVFSKMLYENSKFNITTNDYQYFSYIGSHYIDSYIEKERLIFLLNILDSQNLTEGLIFNEFSYGGKPNVEDFVFENQNFKSRFFFNTDIGKKADSIKNKIKEMLSNSEISEGESKILLLFLINFLDKNANTTSIYAAYLKHLSSKKEHPFINYKIIEWVTTPKIKKINRYNLDVMECLQTIEKQDIIYIDPPYNTRNYYTLYHVLTYIADLNFSLNDIKKNSKTAIPSLGKPNIFSQSKTFNTMKEIIKLSSEKSNHSFLSYNNESFLSEEDFISIFNELKLNYKFNRKEHQRFISRTDRDSHTKIEEWLIEF